jgi:V/A-type H+/Na+-transporting ATPase subunit E
MEQQLQDLIHKIKTEGVEQADNEAQDIIENAKRDAKDLIKNAKNEAESIVNNAKSETIRIKESGEKSLSQAARDLLIGLRSKITELLDQLVRAEINESLTSSTLVVILEKIAQNWDYDKHQNLEILLNKNDLEILEKSFLKKLQKIFRKGFLLKPSDSVDKGFFVGEKGKNTFYDFTDQGLAEVLSQYLNPYLSEILKESASGA